MSTGQERLKAGLAHLDPQQESTSGLKKKEGPEGEEQWVGRDPQRAEKYGEKI